MSDLGDWRQEVDGFFDSVRRELGLADDEFEPDDGELDPDYEPEPVDTTPPAAEDLEGSTSPSVPDVITEVLPEDEVETYPGSRHVRRGLKEAEDDDPEPEVVWDDKPRVFRVNGKDVEFFTVSALAKALRRQAGTIRKWEDRGVVPAARYRAPGEGKTQARLYTRQQIEGLVLLATEEGLMHPEKKMRIDQTRFPERAARLFAALENRG